jgi:DNA-binding NtrC family response regulator
MGLPPSAGVALIVEADPGVRGACAAFLGEAGMAARTAGDRRELLDALAAAAIEVVIANVLFPEALGAELLAAVRARDPDVPVIFVSRWPDFAAAGDDLGAEALRGSALTAAAGYRLGRRGRRRTGAPPSPRSGE